MRLAEMLHHSSDLPAVLAFKCRPCGVTEVVKGD